MGNIVITGDLLRVNKYRKHDQLNNVLWFYNLVQWQINKAVPSVNITCYLPGESVDFSAQQFYKWLGLDLSSESWVNVYDRKEVPETVAEYVDECFSGNFVIGYELPEILLNVFDKLGIFYIDFTIHPIRFLDDIFMGVRTNSQRCNDVLRRYAVIEDLFFIHAGLSKATIARMPKLDLERGSCLFVGQTKLDRSQIRDGKLLTLQDFSSRFEALSDKYDTIYFKPHPYELEDNLMIKSMAPDKVKTINHNVYRLLSNENIMTVYTVSSSIYMESLYFGKSAEAFYPEYLNKYNESAPNYDAKCYVPLLDQFYYPDFWAKLLASHFGSVECSSELSIPWKTSRLRTSLGCYWGYNSLDAEILFKNIVSVPSEAHQCPSTGLFEKFSTLLNRLTTRRENSKY